MEQGVIDPGTRIGGVSLLVNDLDREIEFYRRNLRLALIDRTGSAASLGAGQAPLLSLEETRGRRATATGLYHFALLLPSRAELARALKRAVETETRIQGFADHLVSEAVYLYDPEGNEVELYRDRPRADWFDAEGRLRMATDPLDVEGLLAELPERGATGEEIDPASRIGHVHLNVAGVESSTDFYTRVLGFGLTMLFGPAAGFVSAGGYHHHIGYNTWRGAGLPPARPGAPGLKHFSIAIPGLPEMERLLARMQGAGYPFERRGESLAVRDPSGIAMTIDLAHSGLG